MIVNLCFCGKSILKQLLKCKLTAVSGIIHVNLKAMSIVTNVENCVFCKIIKENEGNKILFEDERVVVFPDIKPASTIHYLIVPKEHITDVKQLGYSQLNLVHHMVTTAKNVLDEKQQDLSEVRFGFHWPPCRTISHLHLHAIAPVSQMNFLNRLIFKENSWWFVSPEYMIARLEGMKNENQSHL